MITPRYVHSPLSFVNGAKQVIEAWSRIDRKGPIKAPTQQIEVMLGKQADGDNL
ncbi:MAG TPA: hypothetical protein VNI79_06605 [Sphingomicrobium sp.]|nr:hypothetical protein [Sphingomicrobium sp.]